MDFAFKFDLADFEEKFLSCPLCFEKYSDESNRVPRVLPCLHTFCESCLQKYLDSAKKQNVLSCPNCRKDHKVPDDCVNKLKIDFTVLNLQDYILVQPKERIDIPCKGCPDKNKASNFCCNCRHFLCGNCTHAHSIVNVTRSHSITSIADLTDASIFHQKITCDKPNHDEQQLVLFCDKEGCKEPICGICTFVSHKEKDGHVVMEIQDAGKKHRASLQQLHGAVSEKSKYLEASLQELGTRQQYLKENLDKRQDDITTAFNCFIRVLNERKDALLSEVQEIYSNKQQVMKCQEADLDIKKAMMESACNFTARTLVHGNDVEILQVTKEMTNRLQNLLHEPIELDIKENSHLKFANDVCNVSEFIKNIGSVSTTTIQPSKTKFVPPKDPRAGEKVVIVLKTYDYHGKPRKSGGDKLDVRIQDYEQRDIPHKVHDKNDGTYAITLTPQSAGDVYVDVKILGISIFVNPPRQIRISTSSKKQEDASPYSTHIVKDFVKDDNHSNDSNAAANDKQVETVLETVERSKSVEPNEDCTSAVISEDEGVIMLEQKFPKETPFGLNLDSLWPGVEQETNGLRRWKSEQLLGREDATGISNKDENESADRLKRSISYYPSPTPHKKRDQAILYGIITETQKHQEKRNRALNRIQQISNNENSKTAKICPVPPLRQDSLKRSDGRLDELGSEYREDSSSSQNFGDKLRKFQRDNNGFRHELE